MAGVDYCTVLPSWEFDKDPACVVSYLFDSIDGSLEASEADYVPPDTSMDSCLTLECSSNDQLTGDSREPCTLSITSKPQYRVSVLGVDIISQSRLLEVYDACEGYMMTSRGKPVPCLDAEGGENQSDMYNCRVRLRETLFGFTVKFPSTSNMKRFNIYNIVLILNPETDDADNVEVAPTFNMDKVRSFVDMDTMSPGAQQLMRSVEQFQQNKKSAVSGFQGMFGQASLRSAGSSSRPGMTELMGLMSMFSGMSPASQSRGTPTGLDSRQPSQSASRGALTSLDNRQPSQSGTRGTPTSLDSGKLSQSASRGTPTGLDSTQPSQSDSRDSPLATSQSIASNIPQSINRTETAQLDSRNNMQDLNKPVANQESISSTITNQMRETPLQTYQATINQASPLETVPLSLNLSGLRHSVVGSSNQNPGDGAKSEDGDMYQLLQNICGRVSQIRTVDHDSVMETETEQVHLDNSQRFEGETGEAGGQSSQSDATARQEHATLRTVVSSCMEELELRLQTHIDYRLSQIEQKLDSKLDRILGVLQSVTKDSCPTSTNIPIYNHTDTPTHVNTQEATHIPTDGAIHTDNHTDMLTHEHTRDATEGTAHIPTYTHIGTHKHTPSDGDSQSTHIHTDTSEEEPRHQPIHSLVMDDESGENS